VEACSQQEFEVIVAHERGHLRSRDNLTRWLLVCAPDPLRWTALHRNMLDAWRHASEDAADDAATTDDAGARADLAALLVKVARLGLPGAAPATVSPFADPDGLERRVRRLIATDGPAPRHRWPYGAVALALAMAATVFTQPAVLRGIYDLLEITIQAGR
jgi:beta-lactamase regulating signal transducer with metallopeptidase domain